MWQTTINQSFYRFHTIQNITIHIEIQVLNLRLTDLLFNLYVCTYLDNYVVMPMQFSLLQQ